MNLRELFAEAIKASSPPIEPQDLAESVASMVPARQRQAALVEALRYMARAMVTETRPSTPAPSAKSWKRDAIRAAETQRRSERDALYSIGDGQYRRLGEFSADELFALADRIQDKADQAAATSARIRRYAEAVRSAGVDSLDDLSVDALTDLGVAA